jgi:hypothetical protein
MSSSSSRCPASCRRAMSARCRLLHRHPLRRSRSARSERPFRTKFHSMRSTRRPRRPDSLSSRRCSRHRRATCSRLRFSDRSTRSAAASRPSRRRAPPVRSTHKAVTRARCCRTTRCRAKSSARCSARCLLKSRRSSARRSRAVVRSCRPPARSTRTRKHYATPKTTRARIRNRTARITAASAELDADAKQLADENPLDSISGSQRCSASSRRSSAAGRRQQDGPQHGPRGRRPDR